MAETRRPRHDGQQRNQLETKWGSADFESREGEGGESHRTGCSGSAMESTWSVLKWHSKNRIHGRRPFRLKSSYNETRRWDVPLDRNGVLAVVGNNDVRSSMRVVIQNDSPEVENGIFQN